MKKTIITIIAVVILLTAGAIYENRFILNEFNDFDTSLSTLYSKIENQTATDLDVYAVQSKWVEKKHHLHAFIPHNEIKEVDLWLAESVIYVKNKQWEEALPKIEVLRELAEQIPITFSVRLENIL